MALGGGIFNSPSIFDPSSSLGLKAWVECKYHLSQNPTGKSTGIRSGDFEG